MWEEKVVPRHAEKESRESSKMAIGLYIMTVGIGKKTMARGIWQ